MISIHAPHAGRDVFALRRVQCRPNFNPRAPCGARQSPTADEIAAAIISIHAPHAGRDTRCPSGHRELKGISIHAPHAGRDGTLFFIPALRAISIHAPHAGRDPRLSAITIQHRISIHAPHAGRDAAEGGLLPRPVHFNPRAPCGARPEGMAE